MATNAGTSAVNPYMASLASFDRMYSATDADTFYNNPSIFYNPMTAMADPAMAMMGMMNPMMMGMYNSKMQQLFTPASYDAKNNGINPMDSFFFGVKPEQFQQYNNQRIVGQNGVKQLHRYAVADNQDDFMATFNKLLAVEKQQNKALQPNIDDETLTQVAKAKIREKYTRLTGVALDQVLKENGDNPFWQGMKDIFSFGLGWDKQTVQENLAYINDAPMSSSQRTRESAMQWLGRGVGIAGALLLLKKGGLKCAWKALNWAVRSPEGYKTWAQAAKAV